MKKYKIKDHGFFRPYNWDDEMIELCEHISINGYITHDDSCEYTTDFEIQCHVCKTIHKITELIN